MSDTNPPDANTSDQKPNPKESIHERPEIKPLIEKAGAHPERRVSQGTMKTGGDVAGGGGTKSLEVPDESAQAPIQTDAD